MSNLYNINQEKSIEYYNIAKKLIPGGVSSPVRAIKPNPFYVNNAFGSYIYDVDNNKYLDYCLGYGPLILGHNNKEIRTSIENQLNKGWLYGTPCELEINLSKKIINSYNSIEMIRFVSTGTEATMSAIRLARGYQKKEKIIKMKGGYHGSHDSVLISSGSGYLNNNLNKNLGIPIETMNNTYQVDYNNIESLVKLIETNKENIACLIMEPILGNIGCIVPYHKDYLHEIRKITKENDIILILDEVITGYRLSNGGAQKIYGIDPDITTLGKIIGGGLPIGAIGGKKEIMECFTPTGSVYQAGTFSGNPLSLCAGDSTINYIEKNDICLKLNKKCSSFFNHIKDFLSDKLLNEKYYFEGISSLFTLFFNKRPFNYNDVLSCNIKKYNYFWKLMLNDGIFLPPSQFETCFVSNAHSSDELEKTAEVIEKNILLVDKKI